MTLSFRRLAIALMLVLTSALALAPNRAPAETASPVLALPAPHWDDLSQHQLGLQVAFRRDVERLADANRYQIAAELHFDPDAVIQGRQRLRYTNRSGDRLDRLVFRLYPNAAPLRQAGQMTVTRTAVNGQPARAALSVSETVLTVSLAELLAPGQATVVELDFQLRVRQGQLSAAFGRLGYVDRVVNAGSWYPTLSVYEARRGWWVEPIGYTGAGDPTYTEIGLYDVSLTLPAGVALIANGVQVSQTTQPDGRVTYRDVTGPVREHAFIASDRYVLTEQQEQDGTRLQVWAYRDETGRSPARDPLALQATATAIATFSRQFVPYPYREFDTVQNPTESGLEFSGLTIISARDWRENPVQLESTIVHEVGHQWFYGLVGSNQVEHPWLDEALATYSEVVYQRRQDASGQQESPLARLLTRITAGLNAGIQDGRLPADLLLNRPVGDYGGDALYGSLVYTRGGGFYLALEAQIGRETLYRALQQYAARHRYQVATVADLKAALEAASGQDLTALFQQWVGDYRQDDRPAKAAS